MRVDNVHEEKQAKLTEKLNCCLFNFGVLLFFSIPAADCCDLAVWRPTSDPSQCISNVTDISVSSFRQSKGFRHVLTQTDYTQYPSYVIL